MTTDTPGNSARLFARQTMHYIVRGGGNDPVVPATGGPPVTTGGFFSFNSQATFAPLPTTQTPPAVPSPRVMSINSTLGATTSGTITTNNGGILIGTLPKGAWIKSVYFQILTAFAGGTNDTIALAYAIANAAYPVATLGIIATLTTYTAGLYFAPMSSAATVVGGAAAATAPGLGPGYGTSLTTLGGSTPTLASGSDIDLYLVTYKATAPGTAFTSGSGQVLVEFTGLPG